MRPWGAILLAEYAAAASSAGTVDATATPIAVRNEGYVHAASVTSLTIGGQFTGSISSTTLTITAVSRGALGPGVEVTGANIAGGTTKITAYGTGTGGTGTYTITPSQTAASATILAGVRAVAGDTLIAATSGNGPINAITSKINNVSDGNTWTAFSASQSAGTERLRIHHSQNCAAGGLLEINQAYGATDFPFLYACAIQNAKASSLDASAQGSSTTPFSSTSGATDTPDELVMFICGESGDFSIVARAATCNTVAMTKRADENDTATYWTGGIFSKVQSTMATQACVETGPTGGSVARTILTFRQAGILVPVGELSMTWGASVWSPTTVSRAVTSGTNKLLVTVGGWWDTQDTSGATPVPTDDQSGAFTAVYNPAKVNSGRPVVQQVAYKKSPSTATHVITPPDINAGTSADGYFNLLEIDGIDTSGDPVRCTGSTHTEHAAVTPPDSNTYQTITVTTTGTDAAIGDKCIMTVTIDMNNTPSNVAFVAPSGWAVIRVHNNCATNVGHILLAAKVTSAGYISATVTWTDPDTFIIDGQITVFKHQ